MELKQYLSGRGKSSALAKSLGISPTLISQWANKDRRIPAERCPSIEKATGGAVRCESLRPDVDWSCLRQSKKAA